MLNSKRRGVLENVSYEKMEFIRSVDPKVRDALAAARGKLEVGDAQPALVIGRQGLTTIP